MKPMIRLMKVAALTGLLLVSVSQSVFAMVCGGGYSSTESNHTVFEHACYEFFFNNSGAAMTSGLVAVYDISGTGVNLSRETGASRNEVDVNASDGDVDNVGTYITTTTTADSELVAGVVDGGHSESFPDKAQSQAWRKARICSYPINTNPSPTTRVSTKVISVFSKVTSRRTSAVCCTPTGYARASVMVVTYPP